MPIRTGNACPLSPEVQREAVIAALAGIGQALRPDFDVQRFVDACEEEGR